MSDTSAALLGSLEQGFLQPYVYYGVVLLSLWFVCTRLLLRWGGFSNRRIRSSLLVVPLAVPAGALLVSYAAGYIESLIAPAYPLLAQAPYRYGVASLGYVELVQPAPLISVDPAFVLSLVGILALSAGAVTFLLTLVWGEKLAMRAFGVVLMEDADYPAIQRKVRSTSSRLGMACPRVGLVEDLRPNAFSIGRGEKATVVFSLGILNILQGEELEAVISHELAHIKEGDFVFKAMTNALLAISFFNPLSYFAASNALKEREMLADERGAKVLRRPQALASALVRVGASLRDFPPERRLVRLAAATFLVSSFELRSRGRSGRPSVEARAWNVLELGERRAPSRRKLAAAVMVSALVILAGVGASLYFLNLQAHMLEILLPRAPPAFSYSSQQGVGGIVLRSSGPGLHVCFTRFEHRSPGGNLGLTLLKAGRSPPDSVARPI